MIENNINAMKNMSCKNVHTNVPGKVQQREEFKARKPDF